MIGAVLDQLDRGGSMVEIELCRSRITRRGSLVVDDDAIRIVLPMVLVEPWVIPVTDVTWVDPLGAAAPGGADASTAAAGGADAAVAAPTPAIIPRIPVLRDYQDQEGNLILVFKRPRLVPPVRGRQSMDRTVPFKVSATRDQRVWAEGIAVCARKVEVAYSELRTTKLESVAALAQAVAARYGTLTAPSVGPADLQPGWQVSGDVLATRGDYWYDPRPVARVAPSTAEGSLDRPRLGAGILAGVLAALAAALAWAAVAYFSGEVYAAAAMAVGFVVGWAVRRPSITARSLPLLGVVAAVLAVAGVLLGWIVLDIAQLAKEDHLDLLTAAKSVDTEYGWGQVLRDPFASPLDWAFFALAILVAFGAAARARSGLARRAR
jgi:hypothetical protein